MLYFSPGESQAQNKFKKNFAPVLQPGDRKENREKGFSH